MFKKIHGLIPTVIANYVKISVALKRKHLLKAAPWPVMLQIQVFALEPEILRQLSCTP